MKNMSDELLIESYLRAIDLKLCPNFIGLLETEIRRRSIGSKLNMSS